MIAYILWFAALVMGLKRLRWQWVLLIPGLSLIHSLANMEPVNSWRRKVGLPEYTLEQLFLSVAIVAAVCAVCYLLGRLIRFAFERLRSLFHKSPSAESGEP